jgi:hypothetical protein
MKKHSTMIPKFAPGDRVAERPKASVIPGLSPESLKRIAKYRKQRYGTVVETITKESKSRLNKISKLQYVRVLWDGMQSPSDHAQMRLCLESELSQIVEGYCAVLGEELNVN